MIKDIYIRDPSDPNYSVNQLEITNEVEILVQDILMILYTRRGEVLGAPDFGANLEEMLYTFNLNEFSINSLLKDQVKKFCSPLAEKYSVNFAVNMARGTTRDICVIDCIINGTAAFGVAIS